MHYQKKEVMACGIEGTYISARGGMGLGHRMPSGDVVRSCGNGIYAVENNCRFMADGGALYKERARRMTGWNV